MESKNDKNHEQKKENQSANLKKKWLLTSAVGLSLVGAGLCVFAEAAFARHDGAEFAAWFVQGLISLILINGGISIFGNAVTQKSYMDSRKRLRNRNSNSNYKKRNYKKRPPRKKEADKEA